MREKNISGLKNRMKKRSSIRRDKFDMNFDCRVHYQK